MGVPPMYIGGTPMPQDSPGQDQKPTRDDLRAETPIHATIPPSSQSRIGPRDTVFQGLSESAK